MSGFRAALDFDPYPLSNFIRPRCAKRAKRGRGKTVLINALCILAFSLVFTPYLSNAVVLAKSAHYFIFHALVVLKMLVSLISRLVACSPRIVVDRQTNRQIHRTTTATLAVHAHAEG